MASLAPSLGLTGPTADFPDMPSGSATTHISIRHIKSLIPIKLKRVRDQAELEELDLDNSAQFRASASNGDRSCSIIA